VGYRQGIYSLTSEQWLFASNEHVWTISAGAEAEKWARVAPTFSDVVDSFRLEAR
jgi:hypothetical protein